MKVALMMRKFGDSAGEQFDAAMAAEGGHICGYVEHLTGRDLFALGQAHNYIFFPNPSSMREIAKLLEETAAQWEAGVLVFKKTVSESPPSSP